MAKPTYNVENETSSMKVEDFIEGTGLYHRKAHHGWEIWYVENEKKEVVGFSHNKLGIEMATELYDDFLFISDNNLSGVSDLVGEIDIN